MTTVDTKFTKTEQKILDILSDGRPHLLSELRAALWDEQSHDSGIRGHVFRMRRKLWVKGHDIISTWKDRKSYYQHVILLRSPYNGVT